MRNAIVSICCTLILAMVGVVAGCGVPSHMQVRLADDPDNVDKEVRFRTTYYFRVFDQCEQLQSSQLNRETGGDPVFNPATKETGIVNDWLYRFRMTGKSSAANLIHFESGTLQAAQIDPFGANVAFDEKNQRFYPISQQATVEDALREKERQQKKEDIQVVRERVANLIKMRKELGETIPKHQGMNKIDDLIAASIMSLQDTVQVARPTANAAAAMTDVALVRGIKLTQAIKAAAGSITTQQKNDKIGVMPPTVWPPQAFDTNLPQSIQLDSSNNITSKFPQVLDDQRKWYSGQLKIAQDYEEKLPEAIKAVELKVNTLLQNEQNQKRAYEALLSQLKALNQEEKKRETAASLCLAALTDFVSAGSSYIEERKKEDPNASLNDPPTQCLTGVALENTVQSDQNSATEALSNAAITYAEKHKLFTIAADSWEALNQKVMALSAPQGSPSIQEQTDTQKGVYDAAKQDADIGRKARTQVKSDAELIERNVRTIAELAANITLLSASLSPSAIAGATTSSSAQQGQACPPGKQLRRGYQILGPEGFRTFNQDERLLMAMSSSAKPLIGVMQELSARVLNQKANESDRLLPIADERIKLLKAQRVVDQTGQVEVNTLPDFIDNVIKAFKATVRTVFQRGSRMRVSIL